MALATDAAGRAGISPGSSAIVAPWLVVAPRFVVAAASDERGEERPPSAHE
jgi:hypothetical protein